MTLSSLVDYITIGKDVVLGSAAAVGAWVAVRGLSTWNRQLKGGVEYELTRRLLASTYRWRETVKGVRHPVMWAEEMPLPPDDERKSMSREEIRHYGKGRAYQLRWDKVVQARNELRTELLEAEVLWGKQIHAKYEQAFKLQQELFAYIHLYLLATDPRTARAAQEAYEQALHGKRDIIFDTSAETEDDFSGEFSAAIASIEAELKPHLKK